MQLPIGAENDFKGVIDLIEMNALVWRDETLGAAWDVVEIPDDLKAQAEEYREKLIETAVDMDEAALEAYLEGNMPSNDELRALVRKGTIAVKFYPMFCGSAFKNKGVQPLLDAVVDYLPAPIDVPPIKGIDPKTEAEVVRKSDDNEPLSMLAFKIMNDPFVGSLTFCRIYSGKLAKGVSLENTVKGKRERIGRMLQMHANSRQDIDEAYAGDIVALAGLKEVTTGDTLCDPLKPVILERMEFPEPVIQIAIEPKTKGDQEKMGLALNRLAAEDPSFRVKSDEESGQTIIAGMGELHLDIIVDRMRREFKVEANVGAPQVAYRETITRKHEQDYTHKKQSGGSGQFARVKIIFEPNSEGEEFMFDSKVVGGSVPKEYVPGVEKGIASVMSSGPFAGFPMIGVKATLIDGAYHDVDFVGAGLRDRRPGLLPRGGAEARRAAARAHHEGRGGDARGLCRRRHRRPELAARPDPGHRSPRHRHGDQRHGAAGQHVQIRRQPPLDVAGPRPVHDAVRPLRAGADSGRPGSPEEIRVIPKGSLGKFIERPNGRQTTAPVGSRNGDLTWQKVNSSARSLM